MGKQKLENPASHQFAGGFTRAHDPVAQEAVHQDHEAAGPPSMGFRAQAAGFRTIPAHPASTSVLGGLGQGMLMEAFLCQQAVDAPPLHSQDLNPEMFLTVKFRMSMSSQFLQVLAQPVLLCCWGTWLETDPCWSGKSKEDGKNLKGLGQKESACSKDLMEDFWMITCC